MAVKLILIGGTFLAALLAAMAQTPAQTANSAATTPSTQTSSTQTLSTKTSSTQISSTQTPSVKTSSAQTSDSEAIVVELAKSINARKAKVDDQLEAKLTMDLLSRGQIVIPRGTRIVGHLSHVKARSKTAPESAVEIAFERVVLKNGREIPLRVTLQALAAPMQASSPDVSDMDFGRQTQSSPDPGPNELRRIQATAFPGSRQPANAQGSVQEADMSTHKDGPALGPFSRGVVGMKGITLSNTAQGSAISSTTENVHLSGGTQLVLHLIEPQALIDSVLRTNR
jgi:hypothetical protein